jgi:SAM-dependent methyltransferase
MSTDRPDWRLPVGVSRGLWNYINDADLAADYDAALADAPLMTRDVAFLLRHTPPGRLLDLGCGTGRLIAPANAKGYRYVGVDLSSAMLTIAAQKAADVRLLRGNIVDLSYLRSGSFDVAACLFGTLGMLTDAEARRRTLAEAYRVLTAGGHFIVHVHNRGHLLTTSAGRRSLCEDLLGRRPLGDRLTRGPSSVGALSMHLFTRSEIVRLIESVGFRVNTVEAMGPHGETPRWFADWRAVGFLVHAHR